MELIDLTGSRAYLLPLLLLLSLALLQPAQAQSAGEGQSLSVESAEQDDSGYLVTIADPFIELHTGPSAGYPIFHVVDRGQRVRIIRQKTNWFRLETSDGVSGWASREQMRQTLLPSGEQFKLVELDESDFEKRKWVLGFSGGEFESAPAFTFFGGYSFTENLAAEVHIGQSVGSDSSSRFIKGNLLLQPLADLSWSPYLTLGFGRIEITPSSILIAPRDEVNNFAQAGIGIQRFISRSFLFRFEINEYVIFSSDSTRNDNEVVDEWKLGFAVFY
jgi:hypothetical protein